MPANTFTYLSERWDSTSWLDHCVSTSDGDDMIKNMFCTIRVHQTGMTMPQISTLLPENVL